MKHRPQNRKTHNRTCVLKLTQSSVFLGTIAKSLGKNGDALIRVNRDASLKKTTESVFVEIDGLLVPFFILAMQQVQDGYIIQFDGITTPEEVRQYYGCKVYADISAMKKPTRKQSITHEIIGYSIVDEIHGSAGKVKTILDDLYNPLIEAEFEKRTYLIPVLGNYIIHADNKAKILYTKIPDDIFHLNR